MKRAGWPCCRGLSPRLTVTLGALLTSLVCLALLIPLAWVGGPHASLRVRSQLLSLSSADAPLSSPFLTLVDTWQPTAVEDGGLAGIDERVLSVHWADVNDDDCPDLVVLLSAAHPSLPRSQLVRRVFVCSPVPASQSQQEADAASPASSIFASSEQWLGPIGLPRAAEKRSQLRLSALCLDADEDSKTENVRLVLMLQDQQQTAATDVLVCPPMLHPLRRNTSSLPAALSSALSTTDTDTDLSEQSPAIHTLSVGLPMTVGDWNFDGRMDVLYVDAVTANGVGYQRMAFPKSSTLSLNAERVYCPSPQSNVSALLVPSGCVVWLSTLLDTDLQLELLCFGRQFPRDLRIFHHDSAAAAFIDVSTLYRPEPDELHTDYQVPVMDACMGDFNGDGRFDYVIASGTDGATVWLSNMNTAGSDSSSFRYTVHQLGLVVPDDPSLAPMAASAVACFDADNDGSLDAAVLYSRPDTDLSTIALFLNDYDGSRLYLASSTTVAAADAMTVADYDNDGRVDVLLASETRLQLVRNEHRAITRDDGLSQPAVDGSSLGGEHWLELTLWGMGPRNRRAHGAIVQLTAGNGRLNLTALVQQPSSLTTPYAQHHSRLHFGLGPYSLVDRLDILWPFPAERVVGTSARYDSLLADQHLHVFDFYARPMAPERVKRQFASYQFTQGRCANPSHRRLQPTFFIIGQWKSGTTSLSSSLLTHPHVKPPTCKELQYFSGLQSTFTLDWYADHFPCGGSDDRTFEASASYLFSPLAPPSLLGAYPDAKLLVMVRDPVERAWSHYRMEKFEPPRANRSSQSTIPTDFHAQVIKQTEAVESCIRRHHDDTTANLTMDELLASPSLNHTGLSICAFPFSEIRAGLYAVLLRRWLDVLTESRRDQLAVVASEQFFEQPEAMLAQILSFVGLPAANVTAVKRNVGVVSSGTARLEMLPETVERLRAFYQPFNRLLAGMLSFVGGRPAPWLDYSSAVDT